MLDLRGPLRHVKAVGSQPLKLYLPGSRAVGGRDKEVQSPTFSLWIIGVQRTFPSLPSCVALVNMLVRKFDRSKSAALTPQGQALETWSLTAMQNAYKRMVLLITSSFQAVPWCRTVTGNATPPSTTCALG